MALTIERALPDVLFCRLPEYLGLSTNRTILTPGTIAVNRLLFAGSTSDGDTLRLKWLGNDHTFTFRNSPDDSGFELPAFSNTTEFNDFVTELENNYYIINNYSVVVISPTAPYELELEALEPGNNYTMDAAVSGYVSVVTPGVATVFAENFSVFAQIYIEEGGAPVLLGEIDGAASEDGNVELYFGEVLRSKIVEDLPVAEIAGVGVDKYHRFATGSQVKYYVLYYEQYGTPPLVAAPNNFGDSSNYKLAIDFGLDREDIPNNTAFDDYITETIGRKVLKTHTSKRAKAGYVDFVSMYVKAGSTGNVTCKVNYYFNDATNALGISTFGTKSISSATEAQIYEFAMVFDDAIAYASSLGKVIDYIEVQLTSTVGGGTSVNSELITYSNDTQVAENFHLFLYKNARGQWDTTYFTGQVKNLREYERIEAQLVNRPNFEQSTADAFTYNHKETCLFEMATGLLYAEEIAQLDEFANSERVFILDGNFGDADAFWRPIIIEPDAFTELDSTDESLESRLFRFKNAYYSQC
jgi:hypothetical protein